MAKPNRQPQYVPYPIPIPQKTQAQPVYRQPTALLTAMNYLLDSPSIPLSMRRQFFMLWENVIFGNYSEKDVLYLMSKFREWCIMLQWFIPEQKWGNIITYFDEGSPIQIKLDLNMLINQLNQLYFINLTRGKDGFTVKEMTTMRSFIRSDSGEAPSKSKKQLRLF